MDLRDRLLTNWRWQVGIIVSLLMISGGFVVYYTEYQFLFVFTVISLISGIISGIVIIVYHFNPHNEEPNENSRGVESPTDSIGNGRGRNQQTPRVGPSSGLTAEEQSVQNEMIRRDYQRFYENPVPHFVARQPHVNGPSEDWETDADTVRKVWKISRDSDLYYKSGNSHHLSLKGVKRAKELGEEVLFDDDIQDEILDLLLQGYRDDPTRPVVSREDLLDALGCSELDLDHNIWFLEQKGFIETNTFQGDSRGYREAEITQYGRKIAE
jgi:biotin operon repressor